jgi:hypothetical protein
VTAPTTPAPVPPPETVPSPPEPRVAREQAPMVPPPGMKQIGQVLAEAAEAANEAGAEGANDCERAYNSAVAMARSLHERMGGTGEAATPDRSRFLEGCARLPPEVQQCMNIGYAVQHQSECRQLRESNPEIMREVEALLGPRGE